VIVWDDPAVSGPGIEWATWNAPTGGAVLETPVIGNNAAPATTAATKTPTVGRRNDLLLRMIGLHLH
jgi:hypothetical protein